MDLKDVNQLHGGIINMHIKLKKITSLKINSFKNFVFDDRLSERISNDVISNCHQCGKPCDDHVNCKNVQCNLLFIQCAECWKSMLVVVPKRIEIMNLPQEEQKYRAGKENKKMYHSTQKVDSGKALIMKVDNY